LRAWLKGPTHWTLTEPDLDKLLTPDDILKVPEIPSGISSVRTAVGVTEGLPKPKYMESRQGGTSGEIRKS